MCAQQRLRSAWASTQSDQTESSLCAQWIAKDPSFLHAASEDSDQTERMPRLIWVFAGRTCHFVGFVMSRLISSWKSLSGTLWFLSFFLVFQILLLTTYYRAEQVSVLVENLSLCMRVSVPATITSPPTTRLGTTTRPTTITHKAPVTRQELTIPTLSGLCQAPVPQRREMWRRRDLWIWPACESFLVIDNILY